MEFYAQTLYKADGYLHYVWLLVTCGYHDTSDRSSSIPSRSSFPSKKIDGQMLTKLHRIWFFLQISQLYFSCLGRSLIGSGFLCIASAKPGRSQELGSFRERRIPSCLFSSCSEKIWVDIWFYKTYSFCSAAVDGQPGAYNTRLMLIRGCHSRAFSFIHPRHWKSASCKDGAPGFLPLLGLWAALQFSKKKPQLCTLWLPLPWRHTAAFLNGKGQNVCGLAPN